MERIRARAAAAAAAAVNGSTDDVGDVTAPLTTRRNTRLRNDTGLKHCAHLTVIVFIRYTGQTTVNKSMKNHDNNPCECFKAECIGALL